MNNIVFTLTSPAQGGKDVCAEMIKLHCNDIGHSVFKLAFADAVKFHCIRNFGYENKDTDRKILQDFGTQVRGIEKDYWVRQVYTAIDAFRNLYDIFVISDARYENELCPSPWSLSYPIINLYVKPHGKSTLSESEFKHESEDMANNPDLSKFHYVIDNSGDLEYTYTQIVAIVNDVIDKRNDYLMLQRGIDDVFNEVVEVGDKDE